MFTAIVRFSIKKKLFVGAHYPLPAYRRHLRDVDITYRRRARYHQ